MSLNPSKTNFLNLLFCFIPVSFIAGNLILNLNILIIILFTLAFYNKEVFKIDLNIYDKLIILFFSYILIIAMISTILSYSNDVNTKNFIILIKTLSYLRFLLLYFVIRFLVKEEIIKFKFFFTFCAGCTVFVCMDMILQIYTGKDIFGYELAFRRASGPFGDELIAGSYLQRFSIFAFFLFYFFTKKEDQKIFNIFIFLFFILVTISIIFSGNKMPFALFLFVLLLIFLLENKNKKIFLSFVVVPTLIFIVLFYSNPKIKDHFGNFFTKANHFLTITEFDEEAAKDRVLTNKEGKIIEDHQYYMTFAGKKFEMKNTYMKDFYSGYKTWQLNKFVGDGIRSYRQNCSKTEVVNCGPHPHNYYFEILADLGLIGFMILIILFFKIFYDYFYYKFFSNSKIKDDLVIIPFFFLFLLRKFFLLGVREVFLLLPMQLLYL